MKLTLLPLKSDDLLRVRSESLVSRREPEDPLQTLLGPQCYTHKVLLSLERSQGIDTSGVCWLAGIHKLFVQSGGKLVLYGVPPVVFDVFNFLRLSPLLHIAASEQAACELALGPTREPALGPTRVPAVEAQPAGPALRLPK